MSHHLRGDGTLWSLVEERAAVTPDHILAVDEAGTSLTFAELLRWSEGLAANLSSRGIGPGSVVAWQLPAWIDALIVMTGLARIGCTQVPIIHTQRDREVGFAVRQTGADLLILPTTWRSFDYAAMATHLAQGSDLLVQHVDRGTTIDPVVPVSLPLRVDSTPEECIWCFYTSGTTSHPKGVRHNDRTLGAAAAAMIDGYQLEADDRSAIVFPIAHIAGPIWLRTALITGCKLLLADRFDIDVTLPMLSAEGVTIAGGGAPFILAFLDAQQRYPERRLFPSARAFTSGAGPKPLDLHIRTKQELGAPLLSAYGCTECPILAIASPYDDDEALATSEGILAPGVEARVLDDHNRRRGPDRDGELLVRAPQLFLGYVDRTLDQEAFDEHGFFRTGDIVRIDSTRHISINGRTKDIIIRKGENISAREVEQLIEQHPDVVEVAVVGLPDKHLGERCCAVVVPAEGAVLELPALTAFLSERGLPTRKLPEQLKVRTTLPRDDHKKLQKQDLLQELRANT